MIKARYYLLVSTALLLLEWFFGMRYWGYSKTGIMISLAVPIVVLIVLLYLDKLSATKQRFKKALLFMVVSFILPLLIYAIIFAFILIGINKST